MRALWDRLTYANVVSTLALFLVLAGGTVYAAKVAKKSVGAPQLKANAVTTAKIKANAVTTRKIKRNAVSNAKLKDGAVESLKIADGSVTGADIAVGSTPFGRVTHEARGSSILAVSGTKQLYPLDGAAYSQPGDESDSFIGALDVRFAASCEAPRFALAVASIDADDPIDPAAYDQVASGVVSEDSGGAAARRIELAPVNSRFAPGSTKNHILRISVFGGCNSGDGISATSGAINVIGTR